MKKIQAGPAYTASIYEHRGVILTGRKARNGWNGSTVWTAEINGRTLKELTRKELAARIDAALDEVKQ